MKRKKYSDEEIAKLRKSLEENKGSVHATWKETGFGSPSIRKFGMDIIEKYRKYYQI